MQGQLFVLERTGAFNLNRCWAITHGVQGAHMTLCHLYRVGWLADKFTNNRDAEMNAIALSKSNSAPTLLTHKAKSLLEGEIVLGHVRPKVPIEGEAVELIGGVECHVPFMHQALLLSNGGFATSTSNTINEMFVVLVYPKSTNAKGMKDYGADVYAIVIAY
eukprot:Gb_24483 [translate_table: standard]